MADENLSKSTTNIHRMEELANQIGILFEGLKSFWDDQGELTDEHPHIATFHDLMAAKGEELSGELQQLVTKARVAAEKEVSHA